MEKWKENIRRIQAAAIYLAMGGMLVATGYLTVKGTAAFVASRHVEEKKCCIVIDAGHGGDDPGKVGINGALEKDINLAIAERIETFLRMEGVETVMTRRDGNGLYDNGAENKKVQDMKRRIALIEETAPFLTVSIHQNSYPEEYVKGAQVFYYRDSTESREAAELMQKSLKERVEPGNKREAKANASYFLLKKTASPVIIVECGFLSNREEAEKLTDQHYQERIAWAVFMGIMQRINEKE